MKASKIVPILFLVCPLLPHGMASEVSGKITIEKRITKKILAPATYNLRGMAVQEPPSQPRETSEYQRIVVWLESQNAVAPAAPSAVKMQQHNLHFEPAVLVIGIGSTVEFPNMDPIFHNIFSLSKAHSFDLGYYPRGQSRQVIFTRSGIVQVYCHVHSSMYGVIVVTSSQWFGKPDENGEFSWSGVPPGKYQLAIWQRTVGLLRKTVVVPENGPLRVTISLPDQDLQN